MKKILLIDVDGKIPNMALMKLSTFYKKMGNKVRLLKLEKGYYPPNKTQFILAHEYDKVFVSSLFTTNKGCIRIIGSKAEFGGTGESLKRVLPTEIEQQELDYSLYPECNYSVGFISRGCIRHCSFCFVPEKEGYLHQVASPIDIIKHKYALFLDNNFLALKNHKKLLEEISKINVNFQFNQGLDARLLDEENSNMLVQAKLWGALYFAYDNIKDKKAIEPNLKMIAKKMPSWRIRVYIYIHPNMDIINNIVYRIKFCLKYKILPYVMRDLSCWKDTVRCDFWVDLASWANQPALIKNLSFNEFLKRRHPKNKKRVKRSMQLWEEK